MKSEHNPPAFPRSVERWNGSFEAIDGMSLRDWFAGQALAGEASAQGDTWQDPKKLAERAYRFADAMLVERRKGGAA